jgi:predicted Zn-dependent protease with MMP-like domain
MFMDDRQFETLVEKAIDEIPSDFRKKMENVSVVTEDWPSGHQALKLGKKGFRGLLLGLYEGVPQTKRGRYGIGATLPDKITIFKRPLLMISRSYGHLVENIKDTVIHEVGHHFGLSEEAIRKAKEGKK